MLMNIKEVREAIKDDTVKLAMLALLIEAYHTAEYDLYLKQCSILDPIEIVTIEAARNLLEVDYIKAINKLV